jgi:signal transduction histidine kinase
VRSLMTDNSTSPKGLDNTARICAALPIAAGIGVLTGWIFNIPLLTTILPEWPSMKVNTALAFVLAGASLWISVSPAASLQTRSIGTACAVIVGLIGALTLTEYFLNRDLGIDQLVHADRTGGSLTPGRPGLNAAFQFFILSLALLAGSALRIRRSLVEALGLFALLCAFLVLLGYAFRAEELTSPASPAQMALHTAVAFIALAVGVLVRDPPGPLMGILVSKGPGGALARTLLPRLLFAIIVLGLIRTTGERMQWFGRELGVAVFVGLGSVVIAAVIMGYARATDAADQSRLESERKLRDAFAQVRSLAASAERTREAERTRIAREIHDELGQALTGVKMDLTWVRSRLPAEPAIRDRFETMGNLLEDAVQIGRRISSDLRPGALDDLGLAAALRWQARVFMERTGIAVHIEAPEDIAIPDERATAAFRICQEALTNVSRHSGASEVRVELTERDHDLCLVIRDNGHGFPRGTSKAGSFGLLGMQERAEAWGGAVSIDSAAGAGTTVTLQLPLGEATSS